MISDPAFISFVTTGLYGKAVVYIDKYLHVYVQTILSIVAQIGYVFIL